MLLRLSLFLPVFLLLPTAALARTTPGDILNSQKEAYYQKVKSYPPENKSKLENLSQKIVELNIKKTDELSAIMERQSQILAEYVRRNNIEEDGGKDGINRNLKDPVANARYWITFAHEAVAFQAAKVYVYNLTSEKNLRQDALNLLAILQADLNSTKSKVENSQAVLKKVVQK